jgi:hypothetical protein
MEQVEAAVREDDGAAASPQWPQPFRQRRPIGRELRDVHAP